jgi:AmmeMemoRadiSam system protein B
MKIRRMSLPMGWYPHAAQGVDSALKGWELKSGSTTRAVISPHAGWFFSGKLAALALSSLCSDVQTIIIAGGHLPGGEGILFAEEDAVQTPLGTLAIDSSLRAVLQKELSGKADNYADNTVEVLLPAVHYFFPDVKIIWMRLSADMSSYAAGKIIAEKAAELHRSVAVIGSTDLTHYGSTYNFAPHGSGPSALDWVKNTNDKRFIEAVREGDAETILSRAESESSACSPGAVLCALGFIEKYKELSGSQNEISNEQHNPVATLLEWTTSADVLRAAGEKKAQDSFVGYAAFEFK